MTTSGIVLSSSTVLPKLCRIINSNDNPFGVERPVLVVSYKVLSDTKAVIRWVEPDGKLSVKTLTDMHNFSTGQLPWLEVVTEGEDVVNPSVSVCVETCRSRDSRMDWMHHGGSFIWM